MHSVGLIALLCAFAGAAHGAADERPKLPAGSQFQLFVENDVLARSDRYYTNGIKLGGGLPLLMQKAILTVLLTLFVKKVNSLPAKEPTVRLPKV